MHLIERSRIVVNVFFDSGDHRLYFFKDIIHFFFLSKCCDVPCRFRQFDIRNVLAQLFFERIASFVGMGVVGFNLFEDSFLFINYLVV